ncbi:MAG: 16S rRNA (guanine(966)-N(2))-methyltransferase RsmD [Elusimicrobia bacterium]|nr:16S rRNA (guanine(966)-N(2))-methyltransferase RsmD [Elusimicrobiota bacterium]MBU2614791.1 16S rRNA (guanine(966)-N(2))-methyltransferase RsmD [Elusimicrobiota bacterium]
MANPNIKIIGGEFSGQQLTKIPGHLELRPILAQIKKSVFDILTPRLPDCAFLDLFAGTGSVGIEALSRGAKHAVFVESSSDSIKMINNNLEKIKIKECAGVYQRDVTYSLQWLSAMLKEKYFDIIFQGPPYKAYLVNQVLKNIKEANLLKEGGVIVAQHHQTEKIDPAFFNIFRKEKYGDTIVTFLRQTENI